MKAVIYYGINDVRFEEVKTPSPKCDEVLIQVKACAICGTDIRIIRQGHKTVKPPAIIGHEISGVIVEMGKDVQGCKIGDKVVVVTPVGCGNCRMCRGGHQNMCNLVSRDVHSLGYYCNGGFAEYMLIPGEAVGNGNLISYTAENVSFEEMSLVEPLSCVINGQQFLGINPDSTVAIFGGGPIGVMHVLMAHYYRAQKVIVIDNNKKRLEICHSKNIGDELIDVSKYNVYKSIMEMTNGMGVDVAIVACSSKEAQKQAMRITGIRGRISFFGGLPREDSQLLIDSNDIHYKEKSIFGAFASAHAQYHEALNLIVGEKIPIQKVITHICSLEDFWNGVKLITSGDALKVVVTP